MILIGMSSLVLFGCAEKETNEKNKVTEQEVQGIDFDKIYAMDDDAILISVQGKELTVKEAKEKIFQQGLVSMINQHVDTTMLIEKYKITDEDVAKEIKTRKDALGESGVGLTFDKESIRYNLAYEKAIAENVKFTEEDLRTIYEKYYKANEKRTFEEMKEELEKQAPHILGGEEIYQIQQELRKEANVTFEEETLKNEFKQSFQQVEQKVDENKK